MKEIWEKSIKFLVRVSVRFKFARVCVVSYLIKGIYAIKCNKNNVGFVEAKKYIKLTKEPNLHGQTLE